MADPTNVNTPANSDKAKFGAEELRALKEYIQGIVAGTLGQGPSVRQSVQYGNAEATNGMPTFLVAGTGLALNLVATAVAAVFSYAAGEGASGPINYGEIHSADTADVVTGLPASNTSYIHKTYGGAWGKTLAAPQYGRTYDKGAQACLRFQGAAGDTTFLDDFGNTWTATSNARLQTNQVKFGTAGAGGGGANNIFSGTDSIKCDLGSDYALNRNGGSWSVRGWVYPTANPAAGTSGVTMRLVNAADFGINLVINNTGGTVRWAYALSAGGAATDLAAVTTGTSVPALNSWNFIELTYDALAGVYRLYVNGVQEATTVSALKLCGIQYYVLGNSLGGTSPFAGYIGTFELLPYCDHPGGTTYAVPTAAPDILVDGYAADYFDIQQMKMFKVTGLSTVAGNNPTLTAVNKLYLGEADTSAAAVTAVRCYAFKRQHHVRTANGTGAFTLTHNLGIPAELQTVRVRLQNTTTNVGYTPGDCIDVTSALDNATQARTASSGANRNLWTYAATAQPAIADKGTGARSATVVARWVYQVDIGAVF